MKRFPACPEKRILFRQVFPTYMPYADSAHLLRLAYQHLWVADRLTETHECMCCIMLLRPPYDHVQMIKER